MNRRAIGRIGLIGAFAAAALVAPWRAGGAQPATTCAGESYLAQIVAVGGPATPAASLASIASPAASPAATTAGSPAASPAATPAPLTIAWLAGASNAAATTAAADAQVRLIEPDASNPHTALRAALRQGAQAVVVDDNVTSAIAPELADAAADGVAVVALGADDAADSRTLDVMPADGPAIATAAAQWLADTLGCTGEVLILSGSNGDARLNDEATAAANEFAAYGVRVVDVVYGDNDANLSFTRAAQTMVAYPDLGGILALTPSGIDAAAGAVTRMERADKMTVLGVAPPGAAPNLSLPIATANPDDAVYLAVQAAAALVGGGISSAPGEQFNAGQLGAVAIGDAGVVVAPPIIFVPPSSVGTPAP